MAASESARVLKVAEVARQLQVDPRTVYNLLRRGELHGVKAGRVWRVPCESLETYLRSERTMPHGRGANAAAVKKHVAQVRAIRGKYRHVLSSVDEYLARKQDEIEWENRRLPAVG